jgi:competence protein ComGC
VRTVGRVMIQLLLVAAIVAILWLTMLPALTVE